MLFSLSENAYGYLGNLFITTIIDRFFSRYSKRRVKGGGQGGFKIDLYLFIFNFFIPCFSVTAKIILRFTLIFFGNFA